MANIMTIQQIKEDIAAGKSTTAYYSSHTLWWTHLDSDVEATTKASMQRATIANQAMMNNPKVPPQEKAKKQALWNVIKNASTPLGADGAPLYMVEIEKWIEKAEAKPEHFGRHKLDALMAAHHHYSRIIPPADSWEAYNQALDSITISQITESGMLKDTPVSIPTPQPKPKYAAPPKKSRAARRKEARNRKK